MLTAHLVTAQCITPRPCNVGNISTTLEYVTTLARFSRAKNTIMGHHGNLTVNRSWLCRWCDIPDQWGDMLTSSLSKQTRKLKPHRSCSSTETRSTRLWANAQRDGRPAEYRWRPLFNAAKFGSRPLLECRAVTLPRCETRWNLWECPKLANRSQPLVGRSSIYCRDMWGRYCCLPSFFRIVVLIYI